LLKSLFHIVLRLLLIGIFLLGGECFAQNSGSEIDKLKNLQEQSLEFEKNGEELKLAQTLSKMALIFTQIGQTKKAIEYYKKSSTLYLQAKKFTDLRKTYSNIGFVYANDEQFDNALYFFKNAHKIAKLENNQTAICGCLTDIAYILTVEKEYYLSIDNLLEALDIAQKIDHNQLQLKCLAMLRDNYKALGIANKYKEFEQKFNDYNNHLQQESNKSHVQKLEIKNLADQERAALEAENHELEMKLADAEKNNLRRAQELELEQRDLTENRQRLAAEKMKQEQEILRTSDSLKTVELNFQRGESQRLRNYIFIGGVSLFLILVAASIAIYALYKNRKLNRLLKIKNMEIEENAEELQSALEVTNQQRTAMADSIDYAHHIQYSMLVKPSTILNALPQSFVFFQPRDSVSGDFYWFHQRKNETSDIIYLAAIDCTGHGVPGAMISMIGYNLLDTIMTNPEVVHPNEILERLHSGIRKALRQDTTENHDGMDMALCLIDLNNKKVEYSGAKNALVYTKGTEVFKVKADSQGIGGTVNSSEEEISGCRKFTNHEFDAADDMTFYLYSDGFSDQFGGPTDKKYMLGRFRNLLLDVSFSPMEQQADKLKQELDDWKGDRDQTDDILIIGFKL